MTSALDTQEVATSQPAKVAQVNTGVEKTQSVQAQIENKSIKWLESLISSIPTSTIDLNHSEEEDDRVSPVPVTVEVGNGNDLLNFTNGRNEKS